MTSQKMATWTISETDESFEFIELYFKGDKENENVQRIKNYIDDITTGGE